MKMNRIEAKQLDRIAIRVSYLAFFIHFIIFPGHRKFLYPSELYTHFPSLIHPFRVFYPRTRNVNKLTQGIENSPSTESLPSSGHLFCFVETSQKYYEDRVPSVAATWLPRCDNGRFFTKTPIPNGNLPFSTVYRNLDDSYWDLFRKTFLGFYYSYTHISKDFDWYLKADDDNYFVIDHLKEYLDEFDPSEPLYLGYRLKPFLENGYNAGGGGYILSNAAVRLFVEHLYNDEELCPYDWAEDRGMGRCLASMGIYPEDTRDDKGLHRFMPFRIEELSEVYKGYHYYPLINGSQISSKFISLHRISPKNMMLLDRLLYPKQGKRQFINEFLELL